MAPGSRSAPRAGRRGRIDRTQAPRSRGTTGGRSIALPAELAPLVDGEVVGTWHLRSSWWCCTGRHGARQHGATSPPDGSGGDPRRRGSGPLSPDGLGRWAGGSPPKVALERCPLLPPELDAGVALGEDDPVLLDPGAARPLVEGEEQLLDPGSGRSGVGPETGLDRRLERSRASAPTGASTRRGAGPAETRALMVVMIRSRRRVQHHPQRVVRRPRSDTRHLARRRGVAAAATADRTTARGPGSHRGSPSPGDDGRGCPSYRAHEPRDRARPEEDLT